MGGNRTKQPKLDQMIQLSLFDSFLEDLRAAGAVTAGKISEVIEKLQKAKDKMARREKEEARRKEQLEAEETARQEVGRRTDHVEEITSMDLPMDWENVFPSDTATQGVHTDSISDGLILSLSNLGRVDIEYIAAVTGADYKTVISTLQGSIYQNPDTWEECFYKGWETAEEYLSGNLMRKWRLAREADRQYSGCFANNVRAIEKVLPPTVATKDIYVTLGSPWVPADVIDDFMEHLFGQLPSRFFNQEKARVKHDEITGTWEIPLKSRYNHNVATTRTYGTKRLEALYILEKTLNMRTVSVTDEVSCPTNASGKKRVLNQPETVLALEKQKKLVDEFRRWVWLDPQRKERLENIFENNFSCVRRRIFDGSFLTFPTMSPDVSLYPYQKDAVARILFSPNTLLAHDVGSGKTYVMIAAGMELRRMGLSKKNLYVVPNNIVGQWKNIFLTMYPQAKLLCVEPKTFTPKKRGRVLENIRDNDYDGVIMAYSCFEQIPLSKEYYMEDLEEKKEAIVRLAADANKATSRLDKKREDISKALSQLAVAVTSLDEGVFFDELGVTRLFVDEAHNYKNVPLDTKLSNVLGISARGSKKCQDMLDKVRMIQKQNGGGGVVMATGTPITNSITDAFVIQQYLQSGELALVDLQNFDSWVGMFAERVTEFEIDVDTSGYRLATRFARFHNLPELTALLSSVADFHQTDSSAGIPVLDGYSDALVGKTAAFEDYLQSISRRADAVRRGRVSRKEDNMLKITTDGRRAALDLRLVDPNADFTCQSKVVRCAQNVCDIYRRTMKSCGTQLVFCDSSIPKAGFNMYDDLRNLLVGMGIPPVKIAFIHDAETESARSKLFERVRQGEIRVLIGSTFKLGLGVNVQDRLIALHHLDVPWRPADMTQREGRILRQGNQNPKVQIFRYVTEGSFDAYSWQLLETKQRFITGLLSGSLTERSGADIEDTVLDYAEVKALAVGDPLVKERVEAANELSRYLTLQRKLLESRLQMEKELLELPALMEHQRDLIRRCREDRDDYEKVRCLVPVPVTAAEKAWEAEERRTLRQRINTAVSENVLKNTERLLLTYRGFQIVLPANMLAEKPFVWVQRAGKYYLELGDTERGNLTRIDNLLETLPRRAEELWESLERMESREAAIHAELAKKESYSEQIETFRELVKTLDEKLGVNTP